MANTQVPMKGQEIYIDDLETSSDRHRGGIATVKSIDWKDCGVDGFVAFLTVKGIPNWQFSWKSLRSQQSKLRRKFEGQRAHRLRSRL